LKPENFAGAKDMDTAIFQAGKAKKRKQKGKRDSKLENTNMNNENEDDVYNPAHGSPTNNNNNNVGISRGFDGFEEEDLGDYAS
jgi:hypothetical protein